jgi:hypothetical protein
MLTEITTEYICSGHFGFGAGLIGSVNLFSGFMGVEVSGGVEVYK